MRAATKHVVVLLSVLLTIGVAGAAHPTPAAADEPSSTTPRGTERIDLRSATSRTFELADGQMLTQLFDKPVFYRDDTGSAWQPVDTRLRVPADRGAALAADRAPARLSLDAAGSADGFLRLEGAGNSISIGLPAALRSGRTAKLPTSLDEGRYAEYADFLPGGVGLRVFPHADGYTMFLVLDSRPATNVFSFSLDAPGLALGPDPTSTPGALALTDADGSVVAIMPRPFMQDSSELAGRGGGLYSEAVTLAYSGSGGHWMLTVTVDPTFLASAVYPLYVDPSLTSFPNVDATAQDTFASSKYPGSNFNTYQRPDAPYYHEMWLGNEPGTSYYNQVFMRFKDLDTVLATWPSTRPTSSSTPTGSTGTRIPARAG